MEIMPELAIEADGIQMSAYVAWLLRPVSLHFADSIDVHLAASAALALSPATVPRESAGAGRRITVTVPATMRRRIPQFSAGGHGGWFGVFTREDRSFGGRVGGAGFDVSRVYARCRAGDSSAAARLSGRPRRQPRRCKFVVIPQNGAATFTGGEFSFVEDALWSAFVLLR